jgi:hypothetical protein
MESDLQYRRIAPRRQTVLALSTPKWQLEILKGTARAQQERGDCVLQSPVDQLHGLTR